MSYLLCASPPECFIGDILTECMYSTNARVVMSFQTSIVLSLAVRGHMAAVRQLFSNRGNHSEVITEYHIGSFRGYGARMNDKLKKKHVFMVIF